MMDFVFIESKRGSMDTQYLKLLIQLKRFVGYHYTLSEWKEEVDVNK